MDMKIKNRMQKLIVAILTMSLALAGFMLIPTASQIAHPNSDNGVAYAAAVKKVKVTCQANGGKFTEKKYAKKKSYNKKINKGKKVGTLPKIKKTGYTFKGWYTKKSGGKKITEKTKIKKNTTFYAQWKKKSPASGNANKRVLSAEEKKLVGTWTISASGFSTFIEFKSDGTYDSVVIRYSYGTYYGTLMRGSYTARDGIYTLTNLESRSGKRTERPNQMELSWTWSSEWGLISEPTRVFYYALGNDENGAFLVNRQDAPLTSEDYSGKWRKG